MRRILLLSPFIYNTIMPIILFLILFSFTSTLFANEDIDKIKSDIREFSLSYQKNELIFGFTLTSLSFFLDDGGRKIFQKNQNETNKDLSKLFNTLGNPYIDFAVPLSIYTFSEKGSRLNRSSLSAAESVFFSTLISGVSSLAIGRHRPYKEKGNTTFEPFSNNDSFPSKHMAASTALFTTYAKYYDAPFLYLFPVLVGLGRLYEDKHYLSDIAVGATVGYAISDYIYKKDKEREKSKAFIPFISVKKNSIYFGFTLNY